MTVVLLSSVGVLVGMGVSVCVGLSLNRCCRVVLSLDSDIGPSS